MKSQAQGGNRRTLAAAVGVVVVISAAACATTVDDRSQEKDTTATELTAESGHHFRGPVNVVIDAARAHGSLTAQQERTLQTIADELKEDRQGRREVGEKLRASAVRVVRSGTANSAEFDRSVGQAVHAIEQRMEKTENALEEIHATLDPDQRAAVATALRAHIDEKFGKRHDHEKGFRRYAAELMLTTLQIDKLKAMKKEVFGDKDRLRPSREEVTQLVDAFEGEDFRSALNAFHDKKTKILKKHVARAGERTDSVLSLLTAAQRDLLADMIQDGPQKVWRGDSPEN